MAFVVEDGTGLPNANSYAAVADADAYFLERAILTWTGTPEQKASWLIQATDYIELRFSLRFAGEKEFTVDPVQALSFPRVDIEGYTGVPLCLKRATYEYANRARAGLLAPDPAMDATNRSYIGKKTKVGPIETDVQYAQTGAGATAALFRPYPAADQLLRPLLAPSAGTRVIR